MQQSPARALRRTADCRDDGLVPQIRIHDPAETVVELRRVLQRHAMPKPTRTDSLSLFGTAFGK